ncbi:Ubiquitin carboxyl-terminal hydrolase 5 [Danaus plexippus plexippus]|uniref:ubiquitinyl hydrolase 1 n=1 Tax=Danaus plexippus plexippus TaxID=278856 RepID=A0A212EYY6_DANPL|nr:Ubiquitin carboxyl-terminal hydrolase 5 [Danaus plexippus plexippus]
MASLDLLVQHLPKITIPTSQQLVYKDECVYSFDNPESETGLYVSLTSFLGFGRNYVEQYFQKTGNAVFLHILREKKPIPEPEQTGDGPEKKITRLAIGVEGGFDPDCGKPKYTYTEHYNVVVLPGFHTFPWPNDALPDVVKKSVQAVLDADSPFKLAEAEALHGTWDGEKREVSVHSVNLKQLDNGVKIPPSGWKCAKCDLTNNLWLNLTDGSILCGRRFFDGSGGNDHAVEHFRATGYPLAVKLGTITADGTGDVYSYAEDDMVEDPYLAEHLKHFGINVQQLQKTEKSMVELELELNRRTGEWNTIQESGSELRPLHGPALTGVNNLGNSCYINSVVQVLFRMPDFIRRYVEGAPEIFSTFPEDPANDFNVQTAKLGVGLISGRYSFPTSGGGQAGVSPHMYRALAGRGHREFSSKRQQDAHEFYLHLLTLIERNSRHKPNPADCLKLTVEERVQCTESLGVRYTRRVEHHLPLPVPVAAATNAHLVLFRMPDFIRRYVEGAPEIFSTFPEDPANDFNVQTAKLGVGLISGRYSFPTSGGGQAGVSPHMYRALAGRGHREFSSKRQQDAHEFYLHLLTLIERNSRHKPNPADCLKLTVEERVQCTESLGVRYTRRVEHHLPLPVPVAAATNAHLVREYEQRRAAAEASGQKLKTLRLDECLLKATRAHDTPAFYIRPIHTRYICKESPFSDRSLD